MDKNDYKIALLIDSENVSSKYMEGVMNEIAKYGTVVVSRFYGDINRLSEEWKQVSLKYSIKPMHQYNVASGKNSSDMAMALDAQEIMYNGKVNAFFLITSDSDFTPLAMHLRENGMYVVGIGNEKKVTPAFKAACQKFRYFEYLSDDENEEVEVKEDHEENNNNISEIIKGIVIENGVDNKIQLSRLGDILNNRFSDFDARKYGAKTLTTLVKTIENLEITQDNTTSFVSIKSKCTFEDISLESKQILEKKADKQISLNKLKQELEKRYGTIEFKTLGFTKFSKMIQSIDGLKVTNDIVKVKN